MIHWGFLIPLDFESLLFFDLSMSHVTLSILVITVNYSVFRRQFWIASNILTLIGICIFERKAQELTESSFKLRIISCQNDALDLLDPTRFRECFVYRSVNVTCLIDSLVITVNYFAFHR